MRSRMTEVGVSPLAWRSLSSRPSALSQASAGSGLCDAPGLMVSAQRLATARPNTTRSSSEFEPRRLAPCTDTQAASPMAYRPGTTASGLSPTLRTTSPW
ncbi:hypothetical protein G6F24_017718 [Rhizopus arrhizus]|nr:hypothetical protein G6F24_017718 [Rhizopus arrhizus]